MTVERKQRIKIEYTLEGLELKDIVKVIDAIRESKGVDFSEYAFSSFRRRVNRFTEINKIRSTDELIGKIKFEGNFTDLLIKEITVNVTEMFRDPSFWIVLRDNIIPRLADNREINIWHAACSTGEEVYSMAILLNESGLLKKASIVATDINSHVLEVASRGNYSMRSQEQNSKNYESFGGKKSLSDYYTAVNGTVHYDKQLINKVHFRNHNLAQDGPFSVFDLIICRNVLIYFSSELQERVIRTFGQSLDNEAYLGIGSKESINWCRSSRMFEEISVEEKIYRKMS